MRRDRILILKILRWFEMRDPETPLSSLTIGDYPEHVITDYIRMMIEENLLLGKVMYVSGQKQPVLSVDQITSEGYNLMNDLEKEMKVSDVYAPHQSRDLTIKYYDSLNQALKKVTEIAKVFDLSHTTAEVLKKSMADTGSEKKGRYPGNLVSDFLVGRAGILPHIMPLSQGGSPMSPIGTLSEVIQSLPDGGESSNSGKALSLSDKERIERQLDEIVIADKDSSFNVAGYELLYTLERMLRDVIHQRIMVPNAKDLASKIPNDVLEGMTGRKRAEEQSNVAEGEYELIEYCDFTDLKRILEKGRNRNLFSDIFSEDEIKTVFAKLAELDPIRKKIAHSRPLTRREFERLKLYASDILARISQE